MTIDVSIEDVLDDFVETVKSAHPSWYDADIQEYCEKMLDALPNYARSAQIIYDILDGNSNLKKAFDEIVEENKE